MNTFAYLARITALRQRLAELRVELRTTTDDEARALIFDEAVATIRRIHDLQTRYA